jgi:hypothetical protein
VPSAPFFTPTTGQAPKPAASPAGITFQYFYEGLFSPTVEGISSTNLANPQLTARIANATGNKGPDQFDFSLVTYSDTAKFNLARLDATGNSGVSGIRNVAVEGDILTKLTAAASSFLPGSSPAGVCVYLPQDNLAGVEVRDFFPLASVSAKTIQAVAFGSSVATNGAIVTGAASTGPAARYVLTPTTLIIKAGSLNVNAGETFRVPFADLASQQVQFFIDTSTTNGRFDNKDIDFVVQGVSTANSSGTGNTTQPSNVARGSVEALITAAETFNNQNILKSEVIQNIFLQGDGGSMTTFQPIGNTSTLPVQCRGNLISLINPSGNLTGLVAAQGNIGAAFTPSTGKPVRVGGVTVGNPNSGKTLNGQLLSLGSIIGDVTINGGLVGGRIAARNSILGNVTIVGTIDSNSALVSGGSIGSTAYGTKFNSGNISGIVAAVGPINVGTIGTTNTARLYKQNDMTDAAVIDSVFSQGVTPLSAADVFDQATLGDLLNLNQMTLNLSNLRVKGGNLSLS